MGGEIKGRRVERYREIGGQERRNREGVTPAVLECVAKCADSERTNLRVAVNLLVPLEVGGDGELHPQCRSCDRLHMNGQL